MLYYFNEMFGPNKLLLLHVNDLRTTFLQCTALKYKFHSWNRNMCHCQCAQVSFMELLLRSHECFLRLSANQKIEVFFFIFLPFMKQLYCTMAFCRPSQTKKLSIRKGNNNKMNSFFFEHLHNHRSKTACEENELNKWNPSYNDGIVLCMRHNYFKLVARKKSAHYSRSAFIHSNLFIDHFGHFERKRNSFEQCRVFVQCLNKILVRQLVWWCKDEMSWHKKKDIAKC